MRQVDSDVGIAVFGYLLTTTWERKIVIIAISAYGRNTLT